MSPSIVNAFAVESDDERLVIQAVPASKLSP